MRQFGILLIAFNLLAGAGFIYLATQDWKGRQSINAAVLRHMLLLQGLPMEPPQGQTEGFDEKDDETTFVTETSGGESTTTISKALLKSYFDDNADPAKAVASSTPGTAPPAPAPGADPASSPAKASFTTGGSNLTSKNIPMVTNQVAEAKRVLAIIQAELAKDTPAEAKLTLLKNWLLYQAETYELRLQYLALLSPKDAAGKDKPADAVKADIDTLTKVLEARFRAVIDKPRLSQSPAFDAPTDAERVSKSTEWHGGTALDDYDRRMKLAHLLIFLDADAAWQKRVMVIVGMRRYVQAMIAQTQRIPDMIAQVERSIPDDQATFIRHETLLREKATQFQARARGVANIRADLTVQKTAQDDAVSRRQTQLDDLTAQLNKVKSEVDDMLVKQSGMEKQLFEIQREVALTLEDVYRLEDLLKKTERERYGMPEK